jgi:hypothetical protein
VTRLPVINPLDERDDRLIDASRRDREAIETIPAVALLRRLAKEPPHDDKHS